MTCSKSGSFALVHLLLLLVALMQLPLKACCGSSSSLVAVDTIYSAVEVRVATSTNLSTPQVATFSNLLSTAARTLLASQCESVSVLVDYGAAASPSATLVVNTVAITSDLTQTALAYGVMQRWTTESGFSLMSSVRGAAVTAFGLLPSDVSFLSGTVSVPCRGSCVNALVFTMVYSLGVSQTNLVNALCSTMGLSTACSTANIAVLSTQNVAGMSSSVVQLQQVNSPLTLFLPFVGLVRGNNFALMSLGITSISIGSGSTAAMLYSTTENVSPNAAPSTMTCDPVTYYWPIMFTILVPIAYIVFRQVYHYGKKGSIAKERRVLRQAEGLPPDPPQHIHNHHLQYQYQPQQQQMQMPTQQWQQQPQQWQQQQQQWQQQQQQF